MLRNKKLIVFFIMTFLSFNISAKNAQSEELIKEAVEKYQEGIDLHKKDLIKKNSSPKHFKEMTKNELLERLFKLNKINKDKKYLYEVTQSKVIPGKIVVKLTSKDNNKDHKVLEVIKTDDGYKVHSIVHLDE